MLNSALGRVALQFEEDRLFSVELTEKPLAGGRLQSSILDPVLACLAGELEGSSIPLADRGTAFQKATWSALLDIPRGRVVTYQALAAQIGRPQAFRAVANACGANPWVGIVPCHRVVRSDGGLGGFAWGLDLKRQLLNREGAFTACLPSHSSG